MFFLLYTVITEYLQIEITVENRLSSFYLLTFNENNKPENLTIHIYI